MTDVQLSTRGSTIKTAYEGEADTNAFTDTEKTKLTGIEAAATADQTGAEIKTAYELEADTNAFTDAEKSKLTGVETSANNYSHPSHTGDVTSTGDGATVLASVAVTGQTEELLPISGDFLLGYDTSATALRKFDIGNLPSGTNLVEDLTPELGGSLDVNGQSIVSTSAGDILITPDTTGTVIVDGITHPTADGTTGQVLETDGVGTLSFTSIGDIYSSAVAKVFADSPIVPIISENGTLFNCDTSSGNIVINLSSLSVYAKDTKFAFVKTTGDANTVTLNRGSTDTINGATSVVISVQYETHTLAGDTATGVWIDVIPDLTLLDGAVTNAKLDDMVQATIKGRAAAAGTGVPVDLTAAQVRTIVGSASETVEGVVERATDAEASAGTDTTRYISPKQLSDNASGGFIGLLGTYATWNGTGTVALQQNQNVASISDDGIGLYTLTIDADYSDAEWAATLAGESSLRGNAMFTTKSAGSITVRTSDNSTGAVTDLPRVCMIGIGVGA